MKCVHFSYKTTLLKIQIHVNACFYILAFVYLLRDPKKEYFVHLSSEKERKPNHAEVAYGKMSLYLNKLYGTIEEWYICVNFIP